MTFGTAEVLGLAQCELHAGTALERGAIGARKETESLSFWFRECEVWGFGLRPRSDGQATFLPMPLRRRCNGLSGKLVLKFQLVAIEATAGLDQPSAPRNEIRVHP